MNVAIRLRMALGGAVCGSILGIVGGGLLGAAYGLFAGNVSLGLDGALLGGGLLAIAGAIFGAAIGPPNSPQEEAANEVVSPARQANSRLKQPL